MTDSLMYTSYVTCFSSKLSSISDCIKSKLAISPMVLTINRVSQPLSRKRTSFLSPTINKIHNLIMIANSISPIYPLPLIVFKNVVHTLKYSILNLICKSLDDGIMDKSLKYAIINPILKKTSLDPDVLPNYRLTSQLPIISKIMNHIVNRQLIYYLEDNYLFEPFQSAYRK